VPAEEPAVYEMLSRADSVGVFQVESRAQMTMLPRLRPREFYDLVIEVAIVRPGPIQGDMVHPYLRRRSGREPVDYPSEALRQVLGKTMGVPLFQEQAMKIAIVGAGFLPEEADRLRRAMATFKRNGDIHLFRDKFIAGMVKNGYDRDFAQRCFSQIEGFGTYGFPESHAASFALLVYVSAWIKCFYPEVFACALLNSQPMGFYAPAQIVRDAREHSVEVRPVDVNHSRWDCTLEPDPTPLENPLPPSPPENGGRWSNCGWAVRLGLRQVKGFAEADAERLVAARPEHGYAEPRFLWRKSGLGRAVLERLAEADAFGSIGLDRRRALWALKALGEPPLPLFAAAEASAAKAEPSPLPRGREQSARAAPESRAAELLPEMPLGEHVVADYASLGLSLKRHPLAFLRAELAREGRVSAADLARLPADCRVAIAGIVLIRQRPGSAKGVVFITIEDETGIANLILWPPILERFRRAALGATLLGCAGKLQREQNVIHIVAERLADLTLRLDVLRELGSDDEPPSKTPFSIPVKAPGGDARDLVIPARNFR
jgi:error-prone DNA polymerase